MTYLPSLIKKINEFYKLAAPPETFSMPDDPEEDEGGGQDGPGLYPKIMDAARQIRNPDIADEMLLIAELYRKAVELNSGFNFVNKGVSNLVNLLDDEDDEEQSSVEDLLNEISRDLRARGKAAGPDNEAAIRAITMAKNEFNSALIAEDLAGDEPSAYEAGLSQYQEGAEGVFDPTGGVSGEVAAQKGRGYYIQKRSFKDWIQSYKDEIQRLEEERSTSTNPITRNTLGELIKVLELLVVQTGEQSRLNEQQQVAPSEATQKALDEINGKVSANQDLRRVLKRSLKTHQLNQKIKTLTEEQSTARTPQEQKVLQEKIELAELMKSHKRGKGVESKWRRLLIESMSGGNSIPPEQEQKFRQKIEEGRQLKEKVTTEKWKQVSEDVAKRKGTIKVVDERNPTDKKRNVYHLNALQLDGLIVHLTQRLATERVVVKQKVTDKIEKAKLKEFKPYMDALAKAITKKNSAAFTEAARALREAMVNYQNLLPEVRGFKASLKYSKFFYEFRDRVKAIDEFITSQKALPGGGDIMTFTSETISKGKKLLDYPWKQLGRSTYYGPALEAIRNIVDQLEKSKNE